MYWNNDPGMNMEMDMGMPRRRKMSKRDIMFTLQQCLTSTEIVEVDGFDSDVARHICRGGSTIELLPKCVFPFQLEDGYLNVEYFRCNLCGKVLVDGNTITMV